MKLLVVASNPGATVAEFSRSTGLTERRVVQIIHDLERASLLSIVRHGRHHTYRLHRYARLNVRSLGDLTLGDFLYLFKVSLHSELS